MALTTREKNILIAGSLVLIVLLAFWLLYFPALDKRARLIRVLEAEKDALEQIIALSGQFGQFDKNDTGYRAMIAARPPDFSLFSFLDRQAEKSKVKEKVAYMQPLSQDSGDTSYDISRVKLKLNELYLNELVDFLYRVETGDNGVYITSVSLSRVGTDRKLMDAVIEAQTLMPKGAL